MAFVGRREDGSIYGLWTMRQWADQEELPDTDPAVVAFRTPPPPMDLSNTDNLSKALKALALCIAQVGGLSVAQIKAMFKSKYDSLP